MSCLEMPRSPAQDVENVSHGKSKIEVLLDQKNGHAACPTLQYY